MKFTIKFNFINEKKKDNVSKSKIKNIKISRCILSLYLIYIHIVKKVYFENPRITKKKKMISSLIILIYTS